MSRLSRLNAFHGMLSCFSSSRLTMLVCKFCSRSLHATDPSYKLPKPHSKKIKQRKNEYYVHNLQCGSFSSVRGSASGNLATKPAVWHIISLFGKHKYLLLLAAVHQDIRLLTLLLLYHSVYTVIHYLAC